MVKATTSMTVVILAALTALGPLATDMYLPAMPEIANSIGADAAEVQFTLSVYLAGFAFAQLICGPFSDRFGRRSVMIVGFAVFLIASLMCALATSIEWLLAGRFLQAVGGAVGPVLGRAAVRDLYEPREAARVLSIMASISAMAPAFAPVIGAGLLLVVGWESIFLLLSLYAFIMLLVLVFKMPEPLPKEQRISISPKSILANYKTLMTQRSYVGYTLINAGGAASLFVFLTGSSFVLIDSMGLSPLQYGAGFMLISTGFFLGTLFSGRYSLGMGSDRLLFIATVLCSLGGVIMALFAWTGIHTWWAIIVPQGVFMFGFGIVMPQSMAGALAPNAKFAGSASSLFGFLQMGVAAAAGILVGELYEGTARPMATAIALGAVGALVAFVLLIRPGQMEGELEQVG